jgi:hypothetical protein
VSVVLAPHLTTLALLAETVGGLRRGVPDTWRRVVVRHLPSRAPELGVPFHPAHSLVPDSLVRMPRSDTRLDEALDQIGATTSERLVAEILSEYPDTLPLHWRRAVDRPARWRTAFISKVRSLEPVTAGLWSRGRNLLDREIQRVGTAVVRGTVDVLLQNLCERTALVDGSLRFDDVVPDSLTLGSRRLVLCPMIAGERMLMTNFDAADVVWLGYPVTGCRQIWEVRDDVAQQPSALVGLLGQPRASILLALTAPSSMTKLARRVGLAPNVLTFHCTRLESARLVQRSRFGRAVSIERTEKGHELIELMAPDRV